MSPNFLIGADLDCSRTSPFTCILCYLALRRMKMGNSQSPLVVPADSASRGPGRVQGSFGQAGAQAPLRFGFLGGQMGGRLVYTASRPNIWGNCVTLFIFSAALKRNLTLIHNAVSFSLCFSHPLFPCCCCRLLRPHFSFPFPVPPFHSFLSYLLSPRFNFHTIVLCRENLKRNTSFIFRTRVFFPQRFIFN